MTTENQATKTAIKQTQTLLSDYRQFLLDQQRKLTNIGPSTIDENSNPNSDSALSSEKKSFSP
jgi:hypothetical protein